MEADPACGGGRRSNVDSDRHTELARTRRRQLYPKPVRFERPLDLAAGMPQHLDAAYCADTQSGASPETGDHQTVVFRPVKGRRIDELALDTGAVGESDVLARVVGCGRVGKVAAPLLGRSFGRDLPGA